MTTVPKPSSLANGLTCKYDAWNRLAEVKDGATTVAVYEYDARNRRVKRHLDSQSPTSPDGVDTYIHYFYNLAWQILETRQTTTESDQPETLQPKYQHVWSARYIDSPILRDENTDADSLCDDERLYYLTDANFNVTSLVDTAGDAVERYPYDPFGKVTIYTGDWSSTRSSSSYDNVYLYTGREYDPETGLYHYRNRYYSVELGAFISRDPIGYVEISGNLYRYASNNPVAVIDPLGAVDFDTQFQLAQNRISDKFNTGYKAIQGWYVIDASFSLKMSSKHPEMASWEPPAEKVGVFVNVEDMDKDKPCPCPRATRTWATLKKTVRVSHWDVSNETVLAEPSGWVKDGGVKWATNVGGFHDMPGMGFPGGVTELETFFFHKSYAIGVICLCDNDKSQALEKARVTYHYSVELLVQSDFVRVVMRPNTWLDDANSTGGWPQPGWAALMGLTPVEECP